MVSAVARSWHSRFSLSGMRDLGFTEYESKLYLTLASRSHAASALEVSKISGLPYTKVYSVLSSLVEKGLVEMMRGKPASYKIIEPERAFVTLKESMTNRIETASKEVLSSLEKLRANKDTSYERGHGASWNISGKRNVLNKFVDEFGRAHRSVNIVFPKLGVLGGPILGKIFSGSRKLSVKLLVSLEDRKMVKEENVRNVAVKYSEYVKSRYALFDDAYSLMIAIETPDYWTGVFETCGNCTRQAYEHFNLAWSVARPI